MKVLAKASVAKEMPMNCAERGTSGLKTDYSSSAPPGLVLAFILFTILLCDFTPKIGMNARSLKKMRGIASMKGEEHHLKGKPDWKSKRGMKCNSTTYSVLQLRRIHLIQST